MSSFNSSEILGKLDELRAIFLLGQRAMPFLEEVLLSVREIAPLMDEINASINESAHKMPDATSKLRNVTEATEYATIEILDLVEASLLELDHFQHKKEEASTQLEAIRRSDSRLIRLLRLGLADKDDALLAQVEMLHEEKKGLRRNIERSLEADLEMLDIMREQLKQIMIALQVQDITSQQIASVSHLIESIRDRLSHLKKNMDTEDLHAPIETLRSLPKEVTFDPHARYDRSSHRQNMAEQVMASFEKKKAAAKDEETRSVSQDEIDNLFGAPIEPEKPAFMSERNPIHSDMNMPGFTPNGVNAIFKSRG